MQYSRSCTTQQTITKKKVDYQEGLEKSRADNEAVTATSKTRRKVVYEAAKVS